MTPESTPAPGATESPPEPDRRPLLKVRGAADYLGVSERWLYMAVSERRLPFVRLPGSQLLRFDPDELDDFVDAGRVEPDPPRRDG